MIQNQVRIRVPVELQRRAGKLLDSPKYKKEVKLKSQPLLIQCPYFPHRLNQTYSSKAIPLSSSTWTSRKSIGRSFSFLPVSSGKPLSDQDFLGLGLSESLSSLLKAQNYRKPTNIQALAVPQILQAESDILIASETGNGKTLSFLLPILDGLLSQPYPNDANIHHNTPRAVVVVPSRELALQIYRVTKSLTDELGLKAHVLLGGSSKKTAVWGPRDNIDILVGTMGAIHKHFSNSYMRPNQIRYLVFDEADTLLDDSFSRISSLIISTVQKQRKGSCQLIFSGATMPTHLRDALGGVLDVDGIQKITTNSLHRIPLHIKQKFIRTSMNAQLSALLKEIEKDVLKKKKVLVFANKAPTSIWLEHVLKKESVPALSFSQHIPYKSRHQIIDRFLDPEDKTNVLIATDLASRGLDFDASLHHVVNYDFPFSMSDYIHRIGRVGRVSSKGFIGRVTSLICRPLDVELLQKIEGSLRLNTQIPNVNSNIVRILQKKRDDYDKEGMIRGAIEEEMLRRMGMDGQEEQL